MVCGKNNIEELCLFMGNNVDNNDWDPFINLKVDKMLISFYLIRKSLLAAVSELKPIIHGSVLDLACGIMPYKEFLKSD